MVNLGLTLQVLATAHCFQSDIVEVLHAAEFVVEACDELMESALLRRLLATVQLFSYNVPTCALLLCLVPTVRRSGV